MRKRGAILVFSLALSVFIWIRHSDRGFIVMEQMRTSKGHAVSSVQAATPGLVENGASVPQQFTAVPHRSAFGSPEGRARLQSVIQEASKFADTDSRLTNFEKSGVDTAVNFDAARSVLIHPYSEPISASQAKEKVLALHFLQLTKHLDSVSSCSAILDGLDESFRNASEEKTKVAIALDAKDLAVICVDVDDEGFRSHMEGRSEGRIKRQIQAEIGEKA